jgi:rare lipoprotein A
MENVARNCEYHRSQCSWALQALARIACVLFLLLAGGCAKKHRVARASSSATPIVRVERGLASWYGEPYHGRATASGEIFDMQQHTAAHRTLPFGTVVDVQNLNNARHVQVRINDRGPFKDGRIIDLSRAAAQAIGMLMDGIVQVEVRVLHAPAVPAITRTTSEE